MNKANDEYNSLKFENINNNIIEATKNVTANSLEKLEEILDEYNSLSEEGKKKSTILNY